MESDGTKMIRMESNETDFKARSFVLVEVVVGFGGGLKNEKNHITSSLHTLKLKFLEKVIELDLK